MRPLPILAAVWGAALLFATPFDAAAQRGRTALATQSQALFMQVHLGGARAYAAPRTDAAVVAVYERDEQVMAVEKVGPYYRVVRPGGGNVGYVLGTELVPLPGAGSDFYPVVPPASASRARFDLYGGLALPMQNRAFADGYGPGVDVGVRTSYRVAGQIGLTARFSYSRFGPNEGPFTVETLENTLDTDRAAFSLLSGALGLDLELLAAGPLAFRVILDGGIYHAIVDAAAQDVAPQEEAAQQRFARASAEAFAEEAFTEWGGSAAFRMSVRLGSVVQLFVEPSYEVILTKPEPTQYAPLRLGLSLGR